MSAPPFRVVQLDSMFDRTTFTSDVAPLDRYLREQVSQDVKRRIATCFVAVTDDDRIAGYYTLSSTGIYLADLPAIVQMKLPRYPLVPATRMGRLAVDRAFKGQGLGGALLAHALERAARSDIATYALIVDAKDDRAADFYAHHGFKAFEESPLTLFLPLETYLRSIKT